MSKPLEQKGKRKQEREARAAAALRENLRRRKAGRKRQDPALETERPESPANQK